MPIERTLVANTTISSPITEDISAVDDGFLFIKPEVLSGSDTITLSAVINGTDHQIDSTDLTVADGSEDYSVSLPDVDDVKINSTNGETYTVSLVGEPR